MCTRALACCVKLSCACTSNMGNISTKKPSDDDPPKTTFPEAQKDVSKTCNASPNSTMHDTTSDGTCPMTREYNASTGEWEKGSMNYSQPTPPSAAEWGLGIVIDEPYALVESHTLKHVPFSVTIDIH